jgi:hypothetical protein
VQIGGYNLNLGSMTSGMGGLLLNVMYVIGIILVVGVVGYFLYRATRNKAQFIYPVTLKLIMDNGSSKINPNIKGGKFVNGRGVFDFKFRIPKQRKHKELGYMPDFSKADADNRLYFFTSGDGTTWQKYENRMHKEQVGVDRLGKPIYKYINMIDPVPIEDKIFTVNSLKNWRETVDKNKITTFAIAIGAFIIMVIAHLISLYIQTKIKCGGA